MKQLFLVSELFYIYSFMSFKKESTISDEALP